MALKTADVISAIEDLQAENTKTFEIPDTFFDKVVTGQNMEKMEGSHIEFVITPTGPGQITSHPNGPEILRGGLRENSVRANEFLGMASYVYDIDEKQIRRMGGKNDLVKLLKQYPDNGMIEFKQALIRQFYMGTEDQMDTFVTLNGQQSYNPEGNVSRQGIFEALAPAAQSGVVHGLAKNSVRGWNHQYQHIGSFRTEGVAKLRQAFYEAEMSGVNPDSKGITDMVCDQQTFFNYVQWAQDRVIANDTPKGDGSPYEALKGMPFLGTSARLIPSPFIDLSQFSGLFAEGVIYGLDPATWNFFTADGDHDGLALEEGWFGHERPFRMPDQRVIRCMYLLAFNAYCTDLRKNFLVTGGANP